MPLSKKVTNSWRSLLMTQTPSQVLRRQQGSKQKALAAFSIGDSWFWPQETCWAAWTLRLSQWEHSEPVDKSSSLCLWLWNAEAPRRAVFLPTWRGWGTAQGAVEHSRGDCPYYVSSRTHRQNPSHFCLLTGELHSLNKCSLQAQMLAWTVIQRSTFGETDTESA